MTENDLTLAQLHAFNDKMFGIMVRELQALPLQQLCSMHDQLLDKKAETETSDQEAPVDFAISAMCEAIRIKQVARRLN